MNLINKLALTALCVSSVALSQTYKVGEFITIKKYQNGSTGYSWYFVNPNNNAESVDPIIINDADCVEYQGTWTDLDRCTFKPALKEILCGQECEQYWRFQAVKPGRAIMWMEYKRGWEHNSDRKFDVHVLDIVE